MVRWQWAVILLQLCAAEISLKGKATGDSAKSVLADVADVIGKSTGHPSLRTGSLSSPKPSNVAADNAHSSAGHGEHKAVTKLSAHASQAPKVRLPADKTSAKAGATSGTGMHHTVPNSDQIEAKASKLQSASDSSSRERHKKPLSARTVAAEDASIHPPAHNSSTCDAEGTAGRLVVNCDGKSLQPNDIGQYLEGHHTSEALKLMAAHTIATSSKRAFVFEELSKDLPHMSSLKAADLNFSSSLLFPYSEAADAVPALGQALLSLTKLPKLASLSLALAGNELGSRGAREIALSLARLTSVRSLALDLSKNDLRDLGAWHISDGLSRLVQLTSLSLNLQLSSMSAAGLHELAGGLGRLPELVSLRIDVSFNELGDREAAIVAASALTTKLKELANMSLVNVELDITGCDLGLSAQTLILDTARHFVKSGKAFKVLGIVAPQHVSTTKHAGIPRVATTMLTTTLKLSPTQKVALTTVAPPPKKTPISHKPAAAATPPAAAAAARLPAHHPSSKSRTPAVEKPPAKLKPSVNKTASSGISSTSNTNKTISRGNKTVSTASNTNSTAKALKPSTHNSSKKPATSYPAGPPKKASGFADEEHHKGNGPPNSTKVIKFNRSSHNAGIGLNCSNGTANCTNASRFGFEGQDYESTILVVGLLVAMTGAVAAWGSGTCSSRARNRVSAGHGARMAMLGSDDRDERRHDRHAARTLAAPDPASREQRGLRTGSTMRKEENFADFTSFSDNVPVVSSWSAGGEQKHRRHEEHFDPGACDSMEAMLEAQVASLGSDEAILDAE